MGGGAFKRVMVHSAASIIMDFVLLLKSFKTMCVHYYVFLSDDSLLI